MDTSDVFITGIGLITPLGMGKEETWNNMLKGASGVKQISRFDASALPVKIAGELSNDIEYVSRDYFKRKTLCSTMIRFSKIAITAACLAIEDARIDVGKKSREETARIGVCIGTGMGGLLHGEERPMRCDGDLVSAVKVSAASAASPIAAHFNINGPSLTVTTACASGGHAIGVAYDLIKMDRIDMAVAGGVETAICPEAILGLNALGVLSRRNDQPRKASRPFDKDRDGFVLSEGAGMVIIESRRHLEMRGGAPYCRIRGWASNSEICVTANPIETGYGMAEVMNLVLNSAHLEKSDIEYINAHGTSTKTNDICETRAIKMVFGQLAPGIPISSTKSMLGHTIGASAAIEVAVCALSIYHGKIHPTVNLEAPDPECDLDYVPNRPVPRRIRAALSNSFGLAGNNCCIALSH